MLNDFESSHKKLGYVLVNRSNSEHSIYTFIIFNLQKSFHNFDQEFLPCFVFLNLYFVKHKQFREMIKNYDTLQ